jgi:FkbM family methyltransferase
MQKNDIESLIDAVNLAESSAVKKMFQIPIRALYSKAIKYSRSSAHVKAKTFWGSAMNVCLPEIVSERIYKFGYFDEDVCIFLLKTLQPGMTFVDVGAHFGFFSMLANHLVRSNGRVISIDPTPSTFKMLNGNMTIHAKFKNYSLHNVAAFDENANLIFFDYGVTNSAYNSLVGARQATMEQSKLSIEVKAVKIDSLLAQEGVSRLDLIKIDAESAELNVLRGLTDMIHKFSPKIILEIGDTHLSKTLDLIDFMKQHGYIPYEMYNYEIRPHVIKKNYDAMNITLYNLLFTR